MAVPAIIAVGCSSGQATDADTVVREMLDAVRLSAIPERWELAAIGFAPSLLTYGTAVEEAEGSRIYRVSFPIDPQSSRAVETWRFDRDTWELTPLNFEALLTAALLFCDSPNDPAPHCIGYSRAFDRLKQAIK